MNTRFCWTLLFCGLLTIAVPVAYAHGHGGGGHGGGHGGGAQGGRGNAGDAQPGPGGGIAGGYGPTRARAGALRQTHGDPATTGPLRLNSHLANVLRADLAQGADLKSEASGFRNLGQFVAAVHVSHNLGIPFRQLKHKMLGGDSLGQAIHALQPGVNSGRIADKALSQAQQQVAATG